MKLSFGMIFSIVLIIVFLGFAFYAIKMFLNLGESTKIGRMTNSLQEDVDKIWEGSQGSQEVEYYLPTKVAAVCFVDYSSPAIGKNSNLYQTLKQVYYEYENMIFYPIGSAEGLDALEIKHLDIENITLTENPFCIENSDGKIKMIIKKNFSEALVKIERTSSKSSYKTTSSSSSNKGVTAQTITTTKSSICTKAEKENLCRSLNIAYRSNYKNLCCSEHDLCC